MQTRSHSPSREVLAPARLQGADPRLDTPWGHASERDNVLLPQKEVGFQTSGVCSRSATWFTFLGSLGWERPNPLENRFRTRGWLWTPGGLRTEQVGKDLATQALNSLGQKSTLYPSVLQKYLGHSESPWARGRKRREKDP